MADKDLLSAESHFAFGKNWLDYAQKIDEATIAQAVADLQRLSGRTRFEGLSFLDIGCGSGLHSLAAIRMVAARVVGVDIDADSVMVSRSTLGRFAPQADARFDVVSVFDMRPEVYGNFDWVYSWGVLHHTGDMHRALMVAASLVKPAGGDHGGAVQKDGLLWPVARHKALVQHGHPAGAAARHAGAHLAAALFHGTDRGRQSRRVHPQLW